MGQGDVSDTGKKKTLSLGNGEPLSLRKPGEGGSPPTRGGMGGGRKTVKVEVRRRRTSARPGQAAADAAQATLLHIHLHHFSPQGGVSGVAVLAESHISTHTWPEHGFAAFDIFMCGDAEPLKAAEALRRALRPSRIELTEQRRGILENRT